MTELKIETVAINSLTPDPANARKHDGKNLQAIENSLLKFGQRKPICVTPDSIVVAGNGTLEAAKNLGWTEIVIARTPVGWSWEQIRAFALADNRTAELAEWDDKVLADQLLELDANGWELEELGFENLEPPVGQDDDDEPLSFDDAPTRSKLGDLWQVGNHRIVCGDCTNWTTVEKLMAGQSSKMIFTDPPYNVDFKGQLLSNTTKNGVQVNHYESINTKHDSIKNDSLNETAFDEFITKALENIKKTNPNSWYFTFFDLTLDQLLNPLRKTGFEWKSIIIWVKNQATLSGKDYKSKYEPIVYGCKPNSFFGERYLQEDVWEFQRTLKNDLHPTMKPIPLIENAIKNSSQISDIVFDPFAGSGSTLVACQKTGRIGYGIELDPKYVDVIISRLEKETGLEAQLLED
jgi:DNA modification methylase